MPINQDKTEATPKTATSTPTQDKPSSGMNASENKPAEVNANLPGRTESNKDAKQPDTARMPDANKPGDTQRDQKFIPRETGTKTL